MGMDFGADWLCEAVMAGGAKLKAALHSGIPYRDTRPIG